MHPLRIALVGASLFLLQSCDEVIINDMLTRSRTQAILPLGSIRVPTSDSLETAQVSVSVSGMRGGNVPMVLQESSFGGSNGKSEVVGPASLSISPVQVSGVITVWVADHLRSTVELELGSTGGAGSWEEGLRFGRTVSIEGFCGVGTTVLHSANTWDLSSIEEDVEEGEPSNVKDTFKYTDRLEEHLFTRAGVHLGARVQGPWVEYEVESQNLFTAPRAGSAWEVNTTTIAGGWAFRTSKGAILLFGRGTNLGAGWIPSAGVQWTEGLSLR